MLMLLAVSAIHQSLPAIPGRSLLGSASMQNSSIALVLSLSLLNACGCAQTMHNWPYSNTHDCVLTSQVCKGWTMYGDPICMWLYTPFIIAWEHEYSIALDNLITELDFLIRSCILTHSQTTATYPWSNHNPFASEAPLSQSPIIRKASDTARGTAAQLQWCEIGSESPVPDIPKGQRWMRFVDLIISQSNS